MIKPICAGCGKELFDFGGILLGVPETDPTTGIEYCPKKHLCSGCFKKVEKLIEKIRQKPKPVFPYLSEHVEELDIGLRALNVLASWNICTIGDLVKMTKIQKGHISHAHPKVIAELEEALKKKGLKFKGSK